MKNRKTIIIVISLATLGIILTAITLTSMAQKSGQGPEDDLPKLEYEIEVQKIKSKQRQEKDSLFNSRGNVFDGKKITELPKGVEPLPTISHWWVGLSALPVDQSTAIVLGEVTQADAHLSGDKTGIYSEFLVEIEKVFKDKSNSISLNKELVVNRVGGGVLFNSGRVQNYRIDRQGMPRKGGRYLLFLKQEEGGDFLILTGYQLFNGRIIPLDGEDKKDPRSILPFAIYKDSDESHLLSDLQNVIDTTSNRGGFTQ